MSHFDELVKQINGALEPGHKALGMNIDSASIRVHAVFEHYINVLIKLQLFGDPKSLTRDVPLLDAITDKMSFMAKVELLSGQSVIDNTTKENLTYLNKVRKVNAHPLLRGQVEKLDMNKIARGLEGLKKAIISSIDPKHIQYVATMDALEKEIKPEVSAETSAN